MNTIKNIWLKFKFIIITFFLGTAVLAVGANIDVKETPKKEIDKVIIKELQIQEKELGILYQGTFKLRQIDSINGELVVVEKDEPIIVGKDFYNSCRSRGQNKTDCINEIKDRVAEEIKRIREKALEEIEMLEITKIDFTNELTEENLKFN